MYYSCLEVSPASTCYYQFLALLRHTLHIYQDLRLGFSINFNRVRVFTVEACQLKKVKASAQPNFDLYSTCLIMRSFFDTKFFLCHCLFVHKLVVCVEFLTFKTRFVYHITFCLLHFFQW